LTGDTQYDALVSQALQFQVGDYNAYMPPNQTKTLGNDDQSCWGLAAMTAAEVGFSKPNSSEWVDYAVGVWNTQAARLDTEEKAGTCGGGLRWQIFTFNKGYDYKNSFANGNFFLLSARLAKFTGNATYSQYADKVFKWSRDIKLVDENYAVYDGTRATTKCSPVSQILWTNNHGIYTEGAALMYNMTGAQNWTDAVKGFVNASSIYTAKSDSVIVEVACENNGKCNTDQRAFKGIFARTMARAALAAPIVADSIKNVLSKSAVAAAAACTTGDDPNCKFGWANASSTWEAGSASDDNLGEVFSALELVQGLLYPSAKALKSANGGSGSGGVAGNGTTNAAPPGTGLGGAPQNTGAAGSVTASVAMVLGGVFVAGLAM
jgi:mannan endo-1,6-alpha-mannosidase